VWKVLDERFRKYMIGNTPLVREWTGAMWAEGPAWNGVGRYVVFSDIPNNVQLRWLTEDVSTEGNPLQNLSHAFLHHSMSTASKYEPNLEEKGQHLVRAVQRSRAEGVIFASPSFCDPALLDRPMLQNVLKKAEIPYIAFKYAENSGQMQPIREQAGTFADSIKLWSGA